MLSPIEARLVSMPDFWSLGHNFGLNVDFSCLKLLTTASTLRQTLWLWRCTLPQCKICDHDLDQRPKH